MKAVLFILLVIQFGCSSDIDGSGFENKCLEDCCYEQFSCADFTDIDTGKNPLPFSVKCSKARQGLSTEISGKTCYNISNNDHLSFCCQKP